MHWLLFCGWQEREEQQKTKLQHFLSDLAILGSLQVGGKNLYTVHSFKQCCHCATMIKYAYLPAGFLLFSAVAEGKRGTAADCSQWRSGKFPQSLLIYTSVIIKSNSDLRVLIGTTGHKWKATHCIEYLICAPLEMASSWFTCLSSVIQYQSYLQ